VKIFGMFRRLSPWGLLSIGLILFTGLFAIAVLNQRASAQDTDLTPKLPEVSVGAVLLRNGLERGQTTQLDVIVTNKSKTVLRDVSFSIIPEGFTTNATPVLTPDIPPFGSVQASVDLTPGEQVGFGKHTLIVTIRYSWGDNAEFVSSQSVTADVAVKRKFEDELGNLFGGGAALLYFLLPVYPAIVAYKIFEMWRKGDDFKWPSVDLANIFPGAVASIAVNLAIRPFIDAGDALDDEVNFFSVLVGSLFVGALIPGIHWLWDKYQQRRWGYTESDPDHELLRKTLTRPCWREPANRWVTVTIKTGADEQWEGFLLEKRKIACVLGATLKATVNKPIDWQKAQKICEQIWDEKGKVRDAKLLIELVEQNSIWIDAKKGILDKDKNTIEDKIKIIHGEYKLQDLEDTQYVEYVK